MLLTKYKEALDKLPDNHYANIHEAALSEILNYFEVKVTDYLHTGQPTYGVLNVKPGHGKTTALKLFLGSILNNKDKNQEDMLLHNDFGCLIVLREVDQVKEMENFIKKFTEKKNDVRFISSSNYKEVKKHMYNTRFLIISHERFRKMGVNRLEKMEIQPGQLEWEGKRRFIFVDEQPRFDYSATFDLDDNLSWVNAFFKVITRNKESLAPQEKVIIRSTISMLFAMELYKWHDYDMDKPIPLFSEPLNRIPLVKEHENILKRFLELANHYVKYVESGDVVSKFLWFEKLYKGTYNGHIDSGFFENSYHDFNKIICSQLIDYQKLDCPIMILDGSAHISKKAYETYDVEELTSYIDYSNVTIHHRIINTTATSRSGPAYTSLNYVAADIENLTAGNDMSLNKIYPKSDERHYYRIGVVSKEEHTDRYYKNLDEDIRPLNLLNTTGKNDLESAAAIYLTALPTRAALSYKISAISHYSKEELKTLLLTSNNSVKETKAQWFADDRLETIYKEDLLSELYQIIHRSAIRNINRDTDIPIQIYIATKIKPIIADLKKWLPEVEFTEEYVEKTIKIKKALVTDGEKFIKALKEYLGIFPITIGRVSKDKKITDPIKILINNNWEDTAIRSLFIDYFKEHGFDYREILNKNNNGYQKKIFKLVDE
ncbi:hypothetical protein [Alkalibacterium sp. 20]|uniref:hypothetical protein n=1 Tax=Alkalibacterium sp. 20 TaxID=1798803 RepID=UPI0009001247|nr:hypothetical protein [Alkalibacterium sp. 20]OJF96169.1 hypothetical protein AX762_05400 [Alkalibacterium sp. 20]